MKDEMVEICEYYENGIMTKKTANGIDIPLDDPHLPDVFIERFLMTKQEVKEKYGVEFKDLD